MKRLVNVLLVPVATRVGGLLSGTMLGIGVADPTLISRFEAWIAAGVVLLADIVIGKISKPMEGR